MAAEIRHATQADAPTIAGFQVAMAMETEKKQLDLAIVSEAVHKVFEDQRKGFYLVAELQQEVVGSLMVTYEWSDWRNCDMWYIQSVFVRKESRKQGLFSTLYKRVVELAEQNGAMYVRLYVETENEKAQQAYESLGMKRMPYYMYDVRVGNDAK